MDEILVERDEGIVTVTINRPDRMNAVTRPMWSMLATIFNDVSRSPEDRVLILTGTSPAFCSGADLGSEEGAHRHPLSVMRDVADAALALYNLPKPTIARVDGAAVGAGFSLALACDLVVASDRSRFSAIFSRRAMTADFGASWVLPRIVGLQQAKELVLLGEMLDAHDAHQRGLVTRVVGFTELDEVVTDWAQKLAAGPQMALSLSKALLNNSFENSLAQSLEGEAYAQALNLTGPDIKEARKAFQAKRPPLFAPMERPPAP